MFGGGAKNESAIVVLHQGALGDFLLTLPVIQSVRQLHARPRVMAVASSAAGRLAAGRSVVDHYYAPDAVGMHGLFSDGGGVGPQLQSLLHLTAPKMIVSFLSDAKHDIHHRLIAAVGGKVASLEPRATEGDQRHITVQWTEVLRGQGVDVADPEPARIRMNRDVPDSSPSKKRVVIHPGSGGRAKCWPVERFMAVADALAEHEGQEIEWMLGPAECDRDPDLHAQLQARADQRGEHLIVEEDLLSAARKIAGAALYLGNDSGMTHLAAALGVRTVAVFGPTDPRVWRPLGENVHVIAPPEPADIIRVEAERVQHICKEQIPG